MLIVTNGTVSRTYKVGDYEPRVVSLSFNIDPGSDVESLVADVVGMVERLARQAPTPVDDNTITHSSGNVFADLGLPDADSRLLKARRLTGDELVGEAHNAPDKANLTWVAQPAAKRKPRLDKDPNDDLPPAMAAPIEAAPTPASVSAPEPEPVVPVEPPTADDVVKAAQAACNRLGVYGEHPERRAEVTAVVNKFVVPNGPVRSTPEAKRADLIAALAELGKTSDY